MLHVSAADAQWQDVQQSTVFVDRYSLPQDPPRPVLLRRVHTGVMPSLPVNSNPAPNRTHTRTASSCPFLSTLPVVMGVIIEKRPPRCRPRCQ